jgi:hypothetical protein
MFFIMLIRRFGLGLGAYFLAYYVAEAVSEVAPAASAIAYGTKIGIAIGAAIVAFFLPRPGFKEPQQYSPAVSEK